MIETFRARPAAHWRRTQVGGGHMLLHEHGLRLLTTNASSAAYSDAQIDDYAGLPRRAYPWQPPLRMQVRARASGPLLGTAGFGFWNNPFSPLGGSVALPAAAWFFHASPPSNLPLAAGVPGSGWRCATLDATTPHAMRWAPLAPAVLALNRWTRFAIWPRVQRDLGIGERLIEPPAQVWRTYELVWLPTSVRFSVDGVCMLETPFAPGGPLGFVAWVDNQWAVATPQGRFGWGLLDAPAPQWLDLGQIAIAPL